MRSEGNRPRALVLVRNTVTHDARILREAATLRALGYEVLVAGVVSTDERDRRVDVQGTAVVRLDPLTGLKGLARLGGRAVAPAGASRSEPAGDDAPPASGTAGPSPRTRLRRLAVTATYHLQGTRLVWQASPELVHANDYNTMWIGVAAKLMCASRLIYDCHELWADRNLRPEWRPWLVACEALFVRVADATITASPGYADELARRYRVRRPTVVRNIPALRERAAGAAAPAPDPALVVYVGGLMPGRGLEQAIRALAVAPGLRLRLIGPGNEGYRESLHRCADAAGVADRVELREPVAPNELLDAVADATAGLMLIERTGRSYELTLPNKLFEYAAAGVPILASDMPVLAGVVSGEAIGEVVAVDDVAAIARGMQRLTEPSANARFRERTRAFAARETWEREQSVLASVYVPAPAGDEQRRVAATYHRYAASARKRRRWDAGNPGNTAIRAELAEAVLGTAGDTLGAARAVLDVGCGTGWWLERLAAEPRVRAELHGIDVLPDRVQAAGSRVPLAWILAGDARGLPYEDGRFDAVFLFTVLSSLAGRDDIEAALGEARRVLAPGGVVLVWEPRLPNPMNRRTVPAGAAVVRAALPEARLESRAITVVPALARRLGSRTRELYPALARVPALRTHDLMSIRFDQAV